MHHHSLKFFYLFSYLVFSISLLAEIDITTTFDPSTLTLGDRGTYLLTISGTTENPQAQIPHVSGLNMRLLGPSTSVQVINGKMSSQIQYVFTVEASSPGEFILPPYSITIGDKSYTAPSANLHVLANLPASSSPSSSNTPQNTINPNNSQRGNLALSTEVPNRPLYVGEAFPINTRLYAKPQTQVQLREPSPHLTTDAFSVQSIKNAPPVESTTMIDNIRYRSYTWPNLITPLKAGDQPLIFSLDITEAVPRKQTTAATNAFDAFFGTGFLDDFFADIVERTLKTPDKKVVVQPLPTPPQEGFCGGIGQFTAKAALSEAHTTVGEPISYKITISGSGNFDRLQAPDLNLPTHFKIYPPKITFTSQDPLGYTGNKVFDYILIPTSEAAKEIPSQSIAYFNPDKATYETIHLPSFAIEVNKGSSPNPSTPFPSSSDKSKEPSPISTLPLKSNLGTVYPTLKPPFFTYLFWVIQFLTAVIVGSIWYFLAYKNRLKTNPIYAHKVQGLKALKKITSKATQAITNNNLSLFFEHIQKILSSTFLDANHAHTPLELLKLLEKTNPPAHLLKALHTLSEKTNALRFGKAKDDTPVSKEDLCLLLSGLKKHLTNYLKNL